MEKQKNSSESPERYPEDEEGKSAELEGEKMKATLAKTAASSIRQKDKEKEGKEDEEKLSEDDSDEEEGEGGELGGEKRNHP